MQFQLFAKSEFESDVAQRLSDKKLIEIVTLNLQQSFEVIKTELENSIFNEA